MGHRVYTVGPIGYSSTLSKLRAYSSVLAHMSANIYLSKYGGKGTFSSRETWFITWMEEVGVTCKIHMCNCSGIRTELRLALRFCQVLGFTAWWCTCSTNKAVYFVNRSHVPLPFLIPRVLPFYGATRLHAWPTYHVILLHDRCLPRLYSTTASVTYYTMSVDSSLLILQSSNNNIIMMLNKWR